MYQYFLSHLFIKKYIQVFNIVTFTVLPVIVFGGEEDVTGRWQAVEVGVDTSLREVFSCVVCGVGGATGGGGVGPVGFAGGGGGEGSAELMAASSTSCSSMVIIS